MPEPTANSIVAALQTLRVGYTDEEAQLHQAISACLTARGIDHQHEVVLGPGCRIDFLAGPVGIEVKKHKPNSYRVRAQLERYAACDQVRELVIVVERNIFDVPTQVNGKPVRYIALHNNWGVAL